MPLRKKIEYAIRRLEEAAFHYGEMPESDPSASHQEAFASIVEARDALRDIIERAIARAKSKRAEPAP